MTCKKYIKLEGPETEDAQKLPGGCVAHLKANLLDHDWGSLFLAQQNVGHLPCFEASTHQIWFVESHHTAAAALKYKSNNSSETPKWYHNERSSDCVNAFWLASNSVWSVIIATCRDPATAVPAMSHCLTQFPNRNCKLRIAQSTLFAGYCRVFWVWICTPFYFSCVS